MKTIVISAAVAALVRAEDPPKTENAENVAAKVDDVKFKDFKPFWVDAQKAMDTAVDELAQAAAVYAAGQDLITA